MKKLNFTGSFYDIQETLRLRETVFFVTSLGIDIYI